MHIKNLVGKLLIATPSTIPGSYFDKSLIYIIKSDPSGTMGVMINSPLLKLNGNINVGTTPINTKGMYIEELSTYSGGPMDIEKGFILELQKQSKSHKEVISLSSNIESLKSISKKIKPKYAMFLFGYCGWDAGQLENELKNDFWLISSPDKDIIFNTDDKEKWNKAMKETNIPPGQYSHYIGRC
jgi:putative transcriptional regulator